MNQSRHSAQPFFMQRVRRLRNIKKLLHSRNRLTPDRVIGSGYQIGIVTGKAKWKTGCDLPAIMQINAEDRRELIK